MAKRGLQLTNRQEAGDDYLHFAFIDVDKRALHFDISKYKEYLLKKGPLPPDIDNDITNLIFHNLNINFSPKHPPNVILYGEREERGKIQPLLNKHKRSTEYQNLQVTVTSQTFTPIDPAEIVRPPAAATPAAIAGEDAPASPALSLGPSPAAEIKEGAEVREAVRYEGHASEMQRDWLKKGFLYIVKGKNEASKDKLIFNLKKFDEFLPEGRSRWLAGAEREMMGTDEERIALKLAKIIVENNLQNSYEIQEADDDFESLVQIRVDNLVKSADDARRVNITADLEDSFRQRADDLAQLQGQVPGNESSSYFSPSGQGRNRGQIGVGEAIIEHPATAASSAVFNEIASNVGKFVNEHLGGDYKSSYDDKTNTISIYEKGWVGKGDPLYNITKSDDGGIVFKAIGKDASLPEMVQGAYQFARKELQAAEDAAQKAGETFTDADRAKILHYDIAPGDPKRIAALLRSLQTEALNPGPDNIVGRLTPEARKRVEEALTAKGSELSDEDKKVLKEAVTLSKQYHGTPDRKADADDSTKPKKGRRNRPSGDSNDGDEG